MLKKINVGDVRLGMFIEQLCGSWLEHPFWKKSFVLDSEKDLLALQACSVSEVMIDTSKGLDVGSSQLQGSGQVVLPKPAGEKKAEQKLTLQEEIRRIQKLPLKAEKVIASLFDEARKGHVLQLEESIELVGEIVQSVSRNTGALLTLSRLRSEDDHTYLHSLAVSALMVALGRQMDVGDRELKSIGLAGLLHDVGKITIPEALLYKPGKLTAAEYEAVKTHSRRGWEMLKTDTAVNDVVRDVCLHHHERMDGTGYPDGLSGEALSLPVRMAAVCDVYDALTSDCSYRLAYSPAEAIRMMTEVQDTHFDKMVFHAFVKTVGIYPAGTLVMLRSGRLGVVTDQSNKSLTTPVVKVFFSTKTNAPLVPQLVDTSKFPDPIATIEDSHEWKFDLNAMAGL